MADDNGASGVSGASGNSNPANADGRTQVGSGTPIGGLEPGKPITIDPAAIGQPGSTSGGGNEPTGKRKYQRRNKPAASTTGPAFQETQVLDVNGCKAILLSIHTMLLGFTGAPEWAMDDKEAQSVAEAGCNVARHYNVATTQKAIDWTNFAMTLGAVYGTRMVAASRRRKVAKQDINQPQEAGVIHFPGAGQPAM